jgi:hypothetical protein
MERDPKMASLTDQNEGLQNPRIPRGPFDSLPSPGGGPWYRESAAFIVRAHSMDNRTGFCSARSRRKSPFRSAKAVRKCGEPGSCPSKCCSNSGTTALAGGTCLEISSSSTGWFSTVWAAGRSCTPARRPRMGLGTKVPTPHAGCRMDPLFSPAHPVREPTSSKDAEGNSSQSACGSELRAVERGMET